jgi:hypothetical protein
LKLVVSSLLVLLHPFIISLSPSLGL